MVWIGKGSNHFKGDENGRAPVWARSVGFNDATFNTASGRRSFPKGIANELLKGVGCEASKFQSFGCCDEVRVLFCVFHDL
tara:strand:+ start:316 stop:558 length:243 start_codon:yes stop_codon:yes gene_type:complete